MNEKIDNLRTFRHEEFGRLRTMMIDGAPWFVANDVKEALGYKLSSRPLYYHVDKADTRKVSWNTACGERSLKVISETGLCSLILSCRFPAAKRYVRWITREVLPALRQSGAQETRRAEELLGDPDFLIAALQALKAERETAALLREEAAAGREQKQPEEQSPREETGKRGQAPQPAEEKQPADAQEDDSGFGILVIVLQEG